MVYTIRIQDNSEKAKSIINMLKAFEKDCDFIEISENYVEQNDSLILKELESRYSSFKIDPTGKNWNDLLNELNK